jgi:hypothetical protein
VSLSDPRRFNRSVNNKHGPLPADGFHHTPEGYTLAISVGPWLLMMMMMDDVIVVGVFDVKFGMYVSDPQRLACCVNYFSLDVIVSMKNLFAIGEYLEQTGRP